MSMSNKCQSVGSLPPETKIKLDGSLFLLAEVAVARCVNDTPTDKINYKTFVKSTQTNPKIGMCSLGIQTTSQKLNLVSNKNSQTMTFCCSGICHH